LSPLRTPFSHSLRSARASSRRRRAFARLYQELHEDFDPAAAPHRAQRWLAAIDNEQLSILCAKHQHGEETWLPMPLAESLAPDAASADPDQPFRHPIEWGAFPYLGR
jgi:hypothetical protein